MSQVWFVTGSSRGLGRAIVEAALAEGHKVVATARNPAGLDELAARHDGRLMPLPLDVTQPDAARTAVERALAAFGRIDVLVNNAGYGDLGSIEDMPEKVFRDQIEANLFGVFHVTQAVLPSMRARRDGHIIQVTSIGARTGVPGLSGYHSAKWGVEGMSEALAKEVGPIGIRTTIIEPGAMRTDWAGGSMTVHPSAPDYDATVGATVRMTRGMDGNQISDPARCAAVMLKLAKLREPPFRLLLGKDAIDLADKIDMERRQSDLRWRNLGSIVGYDNADFGNDQIERAVKAARVQQAAE